MPFVTLHMVSTSAVGQVSAEQVAAARAITEHLIAIGHTRILHLAGPQDWIESESRIRGYSEALQNADLPSYAPIRGNWTADSGYAVGRELACQPTFTAVVAANDLMAIGLMHGFRDGGLQVPHDVSVAGFDDIPVSAHVSPTLTTVQQDFSEQGRRAVATLLAEIRGEPRPVFPCGVPQLRVRESAAPPR